MTRIRKNFAYFRVNYLTIAVVVTVVSMVLNPSSLIVLGILVLGWIYLFIIRQAPLVIGGRTFRSLPNISTPNSVQCQLRTNEVKPKCILL
jgi:PRA1 family protein